MRTLILNTALCSVLALSGVSGCTADIHDNTADVHDNNANIDDAEVEIESTSDMDNVTPGQAVQLKLTAQDVFLIEPSETPPADRVKVAGHFEIFIDSVSGSPILVTAQESISVTIPTSTTMGAHKLMCVIHKHDGTATKATAELDFQVVASVSGG